jgi:4-amino-4-deoxy-L-arabinose transferase-like glycosyltransferase
LLLFVVWLAIDQTEAPWDQSLHASTILRLHDGLLRGSPWRVYELSRFSPPLFHVLAVPASFVSTHPDAYASGNWIALLAVMACTFAVGRSLAGVEAGVVAALVVPAYGWVTWMGRMPMT